MDKNTENKQKKIGSTVYEWMFRNSSLSSREKAMLPIQQMGGFLDEYGMLQLGEIRYRVDKKTKTVTAMEAKDGGFVLDAEMDPNGSFLEAYAAEVMEAYGEEGLDDKMVHQFRMYLDLRNILYIRDHFPGKTDLEKLKAYERKTGSRLDYSSKSKFHNRVEKGQTRLAMQFNDKIKSRNGLSEFIVRMKDSLYGRAGSFVTQWDYLRVDELTGLIISDPAAYTRAEYKSIVETESFNYCKNDKIKKNGKRDYHTRLDVNPASSRDGYESDLKIQGKKFWVPPKEYREIYKSPSVFNRKGRI